MSVETVLYNALGIKPENDKVKWYSVAFFEAFSKLDRILHQTRYSGAKIPEAGQSALAVINHSSIFDSASRRCIYPTIKGKRWKSGKCDAWTRNLGKG